MIAHHQENQQILLDYNNLSSKKGYEYFHAVIGDKKLEKVQEINEASAGGQPFLLYYNININENETFELELEVRNEGKFYFELMFNVGKDISRPLKNIGSQADVLVLHCFFCFSSKSEGFEDLLRSLVGYKDKKIILQVSFAGETRPLLKNVSAGIKFITSLYEENYNIIALDFQPNLQVGLNEDLVRLREIAVKRDCTSSIKVNINSSKYGVELNELIALVKSIPDKHSYIQINLEDLEKVIFDGVSKVHILLIRKKMLVHFKSNNFLHVAQGLLQITTTLEDLEKIFNSMSNPSQFKEITVNEIDDDKESRTMANRDEKKVIESLGKKLKEFSSVTHVFVNNKFLEDCDVDGRDLHTRLLLPRLIGPISILTGQQGNAIWNRTNIVLLGNLGAGKTALLQNLLEEDSIVERGQPILGDRFDAIKISAGEWRRLQNSYVSKKSFLYDINCIAAGVLKNLGGEEGVLERMKNKDFAESNENKPHEKTNFSGLGTMKPNEISNILEESIQETRPMQKEASRKFSSSIFQELAERKNKLRMSIWNLTASSAADSTLPIYMPSSGIFFLVFDLKKYVDSAKEDSKLRELLSTITLHASKGMVFIIGTKSISLTKDEITEVNGRIEALLEEFYDMAIVDNSLDGLQFFPIDNESYKSDKSLTKSLMKHVEKTLNEADDNEYWKQKIRLSWLLVLYQILSEDTNILTFADIEKIGAHAGMSPQEVRRIVNFFHTSGCILNYSQYFEMNSMSVVLNPAWLVNVLSSLLSLNDSKAIESSNLNKVRGSKALLPLIKSGIVSSPILKAIAESKQVSTSELEFVLQLCEKRLVFAKLSQLPETAKVPKRLAKKESFWIVPSLIVASSTPRTEEDSSTSISEDILWGEIVPTSLFPYFICSLVKNAAYEETFRVRELSTTYFSGSLQDVTFEIFRTNTSELKLVTHPINNEVPNEIHKHIQSAYSQVCNYGFSEDISEECKFNTGDINLKDNVEVLAQNESKRWDCFLSHSWGENQNTHKRVVKIAEKLRQKGLKVWVDADQLNDTVEHQILEGIDQSHVFVAFITQKYLISSNNPNNNAGQEFRYGASRDVQVIVPVVLDPNFLNPQTWNQSVVKLKLASKLYIDFSSQQKEEQNLDALVERIHYIKNNFSQ